MHAFNAALIPLWYTEAVLRLPRFPWQILGGAESLAEVSGAAVCI